jgi:hypothetical protein
MQEPAHYAQAPEFQSDGFFDATVCAWYESGAASWQCGPVEFAADETDGADWLFELLTEADDARAFASFAEDHHECFVDREAVEAVMTPRRRHSQACDRSSSPCRPNSVGWLSAVR